MSSDDETKIRCISHLDPPLTPLIPSRWEDKRGEELLNHLYAKLINGEWNRETDDLVIHLYAQVKNGKRDDVTEEQLDQLMEKGWNREWSTEMKRDDVTEYRPRLLRAKVTNREWSSQMEKLADALYTRMMSVEWEEAIKIYKEKKTEMIQMAWITPSKQTALHIAISNSLTKVVEKLLDNIDALAIREMTDNRKENPLHLAASLGQFLTCKLLVKKDPELIGAENVEGETPLFLAVLHGKKEAFYALHPKCPITDKDIKHARGLCKRKDGDTILHVSIRGEYFELAYQIIHWYPELIKDFNNDGQTALHLLAQNPSAFRSGCYLGSVDDFIYSCLIVALDKVETPSDFTGKHCVDISCPVPGNYQTCLDLLNVGKRVFKLIVSSLSWARAWKDIKSDICKIFCRNVDRLPVKNTSERQETSNRDPIQDEMPHDSSRHCQREHIGVNGNL